jgi:hypothetical protein
MTQPVTNKYCSLEDVKLAARIPVADTQDDDLLDIAIISASRSIDGITNRHFYQSGTATRYYVPQSWLYCDIDDVAASTATVAISSAADGTYDITLGAADIQYEPLNRRSAGLVFPATRLRMVGDYSFPTTYDGETTVRVEANFGFATAVPTEIRQATMLLAARFYKRFDSPLGVAGFGDLGAMRVSRTDPDIHAILAPFIHPRAIGIA